MGNAIRALRINRDQINRIPDQLKKEKRWVCWRAIWDNKKGKFNKIPINALSGYNAKSNDKGTWHDFQTALEGLHKYNLTGLGIMLGDGLVGIDIDGCRDKATGSLSSLAEEIMQEMNSYAEVSPSGTGLHILCLGSLPDGGRKNTKLGLEMYDFGRFFTVTGDVLFDGVIEDKTEKLKEIHTRYFQEKPAPSQQPLLVSSNDLTRDKLITKALRSKNGDKFKQLLDGNWQYIYPSQSEADHAFCCMLAFWTGRDEAKMDDIFRSSGLYRKKWDEHHGKGTYGEMTINKAIQQCTEVYTPPASQPTQDSPDADFAPQAKVYTLDDKGNAERFIDKFGQNVRYNTYEKLWYYWTGRRWREDMLNRVSAMGEVCIESMYDEARAIPDADQHKAFLKWVHRSRQYNGKKNMLMYVQGLNTISIIPKLMDRDGWLFNYRNGIMDLRTGETQEHSRDHYITKISPAEYDPEADCPLWKQFLLEVMNGSQALVDYLQKAVGYSLTADTREQCIFVLYGTGANGKSTFIDIVRAILGDYGMNIQPDTIIGRDRQGGPSSDLARLKGARLVTTVEPDEGKRLSEGLIKQLTGGDILTARFAYGKEFEFKPQFKIWMATNHKPVVTGNDEGIWRRLRLIPFTVKIPPEKQDKMLTAKLRKELPGIFNWAVEGCLQWQKHGLGMPDEVKQATREYRTEMDVVMGFIDDCLIPKPGNKVASQNLYREYTDWCSQTGHYALSRRKLGTRLKERGYENNKIAGLYYWKDVALAERSWAKDIA